MHISIIIPIYNVAPYVEQCLLSVMHQTKTKGVECILVDDCGQDNSMEIVKRLLADYDGLIDFRILHHEHNRGLSAARNTGIDSAQGEYLYFLDSDDCIVEECLEKMFDCIERNKDTQVVFAGAKATSGNYNWLDYSRKQLPEYSSDRDWLQLSMFRRYDFGMTAWNKLISRDFVLKNHLRFEEGLVYEDEVWNFEIAKYIQSASFLNYNTYIYNIHENSIVSMVTIETRDNRLFKLWNVILSKIRGEKKHLQVRALSSFILQETKFRFPQQHRLLLCLLFWKLCLKTYGRLSMLLFLQGLLALCYPPRYYNSVTCSRISL